MSIERNVNLYVYIITCIHFRVCVRYSKGPTTFGEDYFDECGGLAGGHDVMGDSMFDM